ncbi:MAG: Ribosomal RNA large subunit methyltransferase E [Gammaproteobacteria bacterium]|nr:Ribosomal RNA large subunit methyltransferase E [Gammaproteobacteria bacterium]
MARGKRKTRNWLEDKKGDMYTRKAHRAGYRSRAAYKLSQIDGRDRLFTGAGRVLDLGAAPGGWSQYARKKISRGSIVALDLLPMEPIEGVTVVRGDFTDAAVRERLLALVSPPAYDLVISDMAPNITGIANVDQANAADLAERVIKFSSRILAKNGTLLVKVFEGHEATRIRVLGKSTFRQSVVRKPDASRDKSREFYLLLRERRL